MLKKYTAIVFLSAACAILLGHNIVSHHHHDNNHELEEHHSTDHHHEGDEDSEDLSHLLSHFVHSADGFTTICNHNIINTFSKRLLLIVAVLPNDFSFGSIPVPPLTDKPPAEHFISVSPHSPSSGLRAPPAFTA